MKKHIVNILKCLCFTVLFISLLLFSSFVVMPKDNSSSAGMHYLSAMGYLAEPENSMDVLFLGDSLVYSGISPVHMWEKYGFTSYDCAIPSEKFIYAKDFCTQFLEKQSPKIVFLETDVIFRDLKPEDLGAHLAESAFSVFSYHDRWKHLTKRDLDFSIDYTRIEPYRGYRPSTKIKPAKSNSYIKDTKDCRSITSSNLRYLKSVKKMCDEKGAKLIIFSMPCQKNWNMKIHNGMQKAAEELGLEYVDMNLVKDGPKIDWSQDSRDGGEHLNHYGAAKVSDYLGRYIADSGLISSDRTGDGYETWVEAYAKIDNEITQKLV